MAVIDFDHTLCYDDHRRLLDINFMDQLPSFYRRPFLFEFLNYLRAANKHNILIMWTASPRNRILRALTLCGIAHYFHEVLAYDDCIQSQTTYGGKKSYQYLKRKYPDYAEMRSVLLDNFALTNAKEKAEEETYTYIYSVEPFTPRRIVQDYGAFGTDPWYINDVDDFIKTKGLRGKGPNPRPTGGGGDTVLLSLIRIMEQEVFGNNHHHRHSPTPATTASVAYKDDLRGCTHLY